MRLTGRAWAEKPDRPGCVLVCAILAKWQGLILITTRVEK